MTLFRRVLPPSGPDSPRDREVAVVQGAIGRGSLGWLRQNAYLYGAVLLVLVLAALVAVPLSLGQRVAPSRPAESGAPLLITGTSTAPAATQRSASDAHASGSPDLLGGRQIIREATVDLEVQDVGRAYQDTLKLVQRQGGYAVTSQLTNSADQNQAFLQVRVPVARLSAFLAAVSTLGHVEALGQSGSDVTQEVVDIKARLSVLTAEEARLVTFLNKAATVKDMLQVEQQLESTRTQIEELQAQQKALSTQVAMATVTVDLRPAAPTIRSGAARSGFPSQLWRVLTVAVATLIYLLGRLVLAVVWVLPFGVLAALVFGVWRAYRRLRRRSPQG